MSMSIEPTSLNSDQSYQFRYTIFEVDVLIKREYLIAKMGMKTHVIPLEHLCAIYRRDLKSQGIHELTIAFKKDRRLKRARLYADKGEEGFESLFSYLQWLKPESDISHLSETEAYAQMGSRDLPWIVIPSLMALGVLLLALIGAPLLIHGLDRGLWLVDLNEVYESPEQLNNPPSRNIKFAGHLDTDRAFRLIEGKGVDQKIHIIAPLLPAKDQNSKTTDQPILTLVSLRGRGLDLLDPIRNGQLSEGILRNVWWEGIGEQAKRGLKEQGVTLSPHASLIEVGVTRRDDLNVYLSFVGLFSLLTGLAALYLKPVEYKNGRY